LLLSNRVLAIFLLFAAICLAGLDSTLTKAYSDALVHPEKEMIHLLLRTIPIHLVYFTAWVGEEGVLRFTDDPYGYDDRRLAAYGR